MLDCSSGEWVKTPSSLWTCYVRTHLTTKMQVNEYFFLPPKAITKGGGVLRLLSFGLPCGSASLLILTSMFCGRSNGFIGQVICCLEPSVFFPKEMEAHLPPQGLVPRRCHLWSCTGPGAQRGSGPGLLPRRPCLDTHNYTIFEWEFCD